MTARRSPPHPVPAGHRLQQREGKDGTGVSAGILRRLWAMGTWGQ